MARTKKGGVPAKPTTRRIEQYDHRKEQRKNNPPVGLVTEADRDLAKKTYQYDPHLDPALQWAGKAEHASFDVPTVSLHVHERMGRGADTGFDHYNTKTGAIESGDTKRIALWMLDPDYDGRSLFPRQVFFPMADDNGGWARLARNLKAEIDLEGTEAYRGTVSLPFEAGAHKRVAVKIVDDRGIESLRIIPLK